MTEPPILRRIELAETIEAGCARRHLVREEESRRASEARRRHDRSQRQRALAMFGERA